MSRLTDALQLSLRTTVCGEKLKLQNGGFIGVGTLERAGFLGEEFRGDADVSGRRVLVQFDAGLVGLLSVHVDFPGGAGEEKKRHQSKMFFVFIPAFENEKISKI